ncbi:DM13 domain-containing protein [Emticicia sp. W12TSBA100-4]|uniref:DM13 domain-containing protein n=1 Tax=Emticicia sp. W12TSBA100-4 TaxID=3160965 RepID=UPI003305DFAC
MKKIICISALIFSLSACQKETDFSSIVVNMPMKDTIDPVSTTPTPISEMTDLANQTLILQGTFTSAVHTTTGKASIYQDKNKNYNLVFENFKTDPGPDLRIYLAEDKVLTNFIQITDKVNTNGSYVLSIPSSIDLKKQTTVVIWCKAFSVLFGSASLK